MYIKDNMPKLGEAVKYFKDDTGVLGRILTGGALIYSTVIFLLPLIVVQGYVIQILRETTNTDMREFPDWTFGNILPMLKMGLNSLFMFILLLLPVQLLLYAPEIFSATGIEMHKLEFIIWFLGSLLGLGIIYITPIIWAMHFRYGGEITDFKRIKQISLTKDYAVTMIVVLAIWTGVFLFTAFAFPATAQLGVLALPGYYFILALLTLGSILIGLPFYIFSLQCISMYIIGVSITKVDPGKPNGKQERNQVSTS